MKRPIKIPAANLNASEYGEQKTVIDFWRVYCRTKRLDERLLMAIPNGAHLAGTPKQRAIQMHRLKATGLRPGAPDLLLAIPKMMRGIQPQPMLFAGLFVEMKRKGGKPNKEQLEYADLLRRAGYNAVIVEGTDAAMRAILQYLVS